MGLFDVFKKKTDLILFRFNFKDYPELLTLYRKYRELGWNAIKYENKKNYKKADYFQCEKENFIENVLSKEIFNLFKNRKPLLYNSDEDFYLEWDKHFDDSFEHLSKEKKYDLVGLIDGDFIYELPKEYYNN